MEATSLLGGKHGWLDAETLGSQVQTPASTYTPPLSSGGGREGLSQRVKDLVASGCHMFPRSRDRT